MVKKVFGATSKWAEGIEEQLDDINKGEINSQYINLNQIILDSDNSRTFILTREEVESGPKLPKGDFDEETQLAFERLVSEHFKGSNNSNSKVDEYMSLARFANTIGAPEKLINPVTGYMVDMRFHLIAGHRRTMAHIIMGAKSISCQILNHKPSALEASIIQWSENESREDLTLSDQLRSVYRVIRSWEGANNKKISLPILSSLLSLKDTKSAWILKLHRMNNAALEMAIKLNQVTSLEAAYKICSIKDEKLKERVISKSSDIKITGPQQLQDVINMLKVADGGSNKTPTAPNRSAARKPLNIKVKGKDAESLLTLMVEALEKSNFSEQIRASSQKKLWDELKSEYLNVSEEVGV